MRVKTILAVGLILALFLTGTVSSFAVEQKEAPKVDGTSVIMIDSSTGDVLYEKNAGERRDPASVTKIMTCLLVLENMKLDDKVTVMEKSSPVGINIDMKKGEVLTVEQLLYALMLPSANDAARVLAIATAGDIDTFCDMMNERAKACGATDTHFTNPNGLNLPGQENHKTTASDLAKITRVALQNKTFRKIVATRKYTIPETNKSEERKLKCTDPLLGSKKSVEVDGKEIPLRYPYAIGVKTGTTSTAGNCFVGAALQDDTELIVVTLNSGDMTRFTDAIRLFDYGYAHYQTQIIAAKGAETEQMKVRRGETGKVAIGPSDVLAVTLEKDEQGQPVEKPTTLELQKNEKKLTAPVKKGDVIGTYQLKDENGTLIRQADAIALATVGKGGILSYIGIPDDRVPVVVIVFLTVLLILFVILLLLRNRKKQAKRGAKRKTKPVSSSSGSGKPAPKKTAKTTKPAQKKPATSQRSSASQSPSIGDWPVDPAWSTQRPRPSEAIRPSEAERSQATRRAPEEEYKSDAARRLAERREKRKREQNRK